MKRIERKADPAILSEAMKNRILRCLILFTLFGIIAAAAGCGSQKQDMGQADTCFIYTDGLLDDLCAMEYLSERYENAIIMLQDPEGLPDSPYASDKVTDESLLLGAASGWFKRVTPYSDSADIAEADLYLLAPLTEFAELLKADPLLEEKNALIMAGDSDGPEGAGEEWNASVDLDAYRYVTENMTELIQMTRPACEAAFEENGYPMDAEFLDEYITRMKAMNENVCCYDLQAVALFFH